MNNLKAPLIVGIISLIFGLTALFGAIRGNVITAGGFASAAGIAGLAAGIGSLRSREDD